MVYYGMLLHIMVDYGILWSIMVYYGLLWVDYGILWVDYPYGILWYANVHVTYTILVPLTLQVRFTPLRGEFSGVELCKVFRKLGRLIILVSERRKGTIW